MKVLVHWAATVGIALCAATPALARDVALVVSNANYPKLDIQTPDDDVAQLTQVLRQRGFDVQVARDVTAPEAWRKLRGFSAEVDEAERVVVVLHGIAVSGARDSWVLGWQTEGPDRFGVGGSGVAASAVLDMLADKPGRAALIVAELTSGSAAGAGLTPGIGDVAVPQGVSLLAGPADIVPGFAERALLRPGRAIGAYLSDAPEGVSVRGYLPDAQAFLPRAQADVLFRDRDFWRTAEIIGTVDSLTAYLERFPQGQHAQEAQDRIAELREAGQQEKMRKAEAALNLDRDARRAIQRDLVVLGYDTGGIDGIFGRGTRAAIGRWQRKTDLKVSGYLTGNQVVRLNKQATKRAKALEEAAKVRRAQLEQLDRAYWQRTGGGQSENGIMEYLARYPDGLYASQARQRLDEIEGQKRKRAAARERAAWEEATSANTKAGYWAYLRSYPKGEFALAARNRIDRIRRDDANREIFAAARAEEQQLAGNPFVRSLIEQRLAELQLDPGNADGRFDKQTRKALRKFQRDRELPVSGYATRATLMHLLAGLGR